MNLISTISTLLSSLDLLDDLSSRVYRIEQDYKLMVAECRRLSSENLRLQCQLREALKSHVSV